MKQIKFECKLLSDVVLKSTSASDGVSENLDYIPGSKFLGITAKSLYNSDNAEKTLDIFHNGNVQFGDAHICIEGNRTLKVPASWFFKKGDNIGDDKYLHHKLTTEIKQQLSAEKNQLKQARKGYFTDGKYINTDSNFSIKSAYDSNKRKAKDSQMYGYFALPKGSVWEFTVMTKSEYVDEIVSSLVGRKRIGRSRSAEYGLIEINHVKNNTVNSDVNIKQGEIIVYAESNLCFYNELGQNTLQPSAEQLGFDEGATIVWAKSQIRTRTYQTWNSKRYNRDADRVVIEKGSVFVVETKSDISTSDFNKSIGSHKNEGFGKVIINPDFLNSDNEKLNLPLEKYENNAIDVKYLTKAGDKDAILIEFLKSKQTEKERVLGVDELVNKFTKKNLRTFKGITASQWGQVRNYAKHASNEKSLEQLLFAKEVGYFMHGQSEHKWRESNKRWILEEYLFGANPIVPKGSKLEFVQKLASEMGKHVKSKKQENA